MQGGIPSVTLAIGSAPYQKTLVSSLLQAGMLRRWLSSSPQLEIQEPNGDGTLKVIQQFPFNQFANRMLWGIWRRMPKPLRPGSPVMATILLREHYYSRWIPPCNLFHGWMGVSLKSVRIAKQRGALTLLENPGRHADRFHRVTHEECDRFHIKNSERSPLLPTALIQRIKREYEICDYVIVPSKIAHRSFAEFGYGGKTIVVPPGVDARFFSPREQGEGARPFRVCFVGRVELAKGAGYLLQAWKQLALANAELVLAGEVRPEMKSLLESYADSTVRTTGVLTSGELADLYRESDVFAFPSVNEGLAQVLLEAMASGLVVVASDLSGAEDCVTEGQDGFIVPARDVDRTAQAILWCYQNQEASHAMGRAGRAKVESQFTLAHYDQRMIALYRELVHAVRR